MRFIIAPVVAITLAAPVSAQDTETEAEAGCRAQADMVVEAFNSRRDGDSKRKVRRGLREAVGRTAGDMLADHIWTVPPESLTDEAIAAVGKDFMAKCLTL